MYRIRKLTSHMPLDYEIVITCYCYYYYYYYYYYAAFNAPCVGHTDDKSQACYLPLDSGDIFALTPAKLVVDLATPEKCQAAWTSWLVTYGDGIPAHRQSPIPVVTGPDVG